MSLVIPVHSPQMGDKTDAEMVIVPTIRHYQFHFMTENYKAELLNDNHLKYKSGVK